MPVIGPLGQALRASRLAVTSELREERTRLEESQAQLRGRDRELQDARSQLQQIQAQASVAQRSLQSVQSSEAALRSELYEASTAVLRGAEQQRQAVEHARAELEAKGAELEAAQLQADAARASVEASSSREEELQEHCRSLADNEATLRANLHDLECRRVDFAELQAREEAFEERLRAAQAQLPLAEERQGAPAEILQAQAALASALAEAEALRARENSGAAELRALREELTQERERKEEEVALMKGHSPWQKQAKQRDSSRHRASPKRRFVQHFGGMLRFGTVTGPRFGSTGTKQRKASRRAASRRRASAERAGAPGQAAASDAAEAVDDIEATGSGGLEREVSGI